MNCAACCTPIEDEVGLQCTILSCNKFYHLLCAGGITSYKSPVSAWVCPECCCAAKKGGDNSLTPVGISKKSKDSNVTVRKHVRSANVTRLECDNSEEIPPNENCRLRQEVQLLRHQIEHSISVTKINDARMETHSAHMEELEKKLKRYEATNDALSKQLAKYVSNVELLVNKMVLVEASCNRVTPDIVSNYQTPSVAENKNRNNPITTADVTTKTLPRAEPRQRLPAHAPEVPISTPTSTHACSAVATAGACVPVAPPPTSSVRATTCAQTVAVDSVGDTVSTYDALTTVLENNITEDGWRRVQNRKAKRDKAKQQQHGRNVIKGSGISDDELKTVERVRKIHACFFRPETTAETMLSYMKRKRQCDDYHVVKLNLAHKHYSSFSITVPTSYFDFFMSAENWPTSTQVSEWFRRSDGRAGGTSWQPHRYSQNTVALETPRATRNNTAHTKTLPAAVGHRATVNEDSRGRACARLAYTDTGPAGSDRAASVAVTNTSQATYACCAGTDTQPAVRTRASGPITSK